MSPKSGILTHEEKEAYERINKSLAIQKKSFEDYVSKLSLQNLQCIQETCDALQLSIDIKTGNISYKPSFQPLNLTYDICYVRHGKTEGNTEPRVFQGQVDYPENQLNHVGVQQAEEAAVLMETLIKEQNWLPDVIILSPLNRAIETGSHFYNNHKEIPTVIVPEAAEICFGCWDNMRVIDIPPNSLCHLFYLDQNALVRSPQASTINEKTRPDGYYKTGNQIPAESFLDVLVRMRKVLISLENNKNIKNKSNQGLRPKVLMYGHSMAGAAVSILMGHGQYIQQSANSSKHLGFDGQCIMKHATPTLLLPKKP
ncbi:mannitol-1-phosphatase-like [Hylaeus volcanicus]|uniref:mannitol-1-phosphatase-like n=1 Tax=Hylaeus volcanicus TaxID=313075 RepID=UPI0023B8719C|nr:mannitol-1-phosphatase-like [Hylaeus volcanicus]